MTPEGQPPLRRAIELYLEHYEMMSLLQVVLEHLSLGELIDCLEHLPPNSQQAIIKELLERCPPPELPNDLHSWEF